MTYEVQFQLADAQYTVRGPDIDGVLALIQGVQGTEVVPEHEARRDAAEATLKCLKYEWCGGEQWVPPIQSTPEPVWIAWSGWERPVAPGQRVLVECRNGALSLMSACYCDWEHQGRQSDIVRYRVCE